MSCSIVGPSSRMRMATRWLLAAALVCVAPHVFAFNVFAVGGDAACNFHDIQQAINASTASDGNTIFVARNYTYSNQGLVINDRKVNILGGYATCSGTTVGASTQITGSSQSVIAIGGNSVVYLANLDISGAAIDGNHKGGGVYFGGSGSLEIVSSWIHGNRAGYGAGIDMSPSGSATLTLLSSLISANTASGQGGGIRLEGQSFLTADSNTYITGNVATGHDDVGFGGGIELVGPAYGKISANVNNNTATYGGGVAALASNSDPVTVHLYSTSANVAALYGNHATSTGGGIYLKPSGEGAIAKLCANDFVIDANTAQNGAAIYADTNGGHGARAYLNSPDCTPPLDAVPCATGPLCNEIADNVASQVGSAVVLIQSNGDLYANRFAARRNQGGRLIELIADTQVTAAFLQDCLLADNILTSNLLWSTGGSSDTYLYMSTCTITHNQLGSSDSVINTTVANLGVIASIIDQPSHQSLVSTSTAYTQYVLTNDTSSFVGGAGIEQGAPTFVDVANGDYHQQRTSLGVDYAPVLLGNNLGVDLDGHPRTLDLTDVPNQFGPTDLGAYEIQTQPTGPGPCSAADTIFCNGFELPN